MAMAGLDTSSISIFTDALTQQPELVELSEKVRVTAHDSPNPESIVTVTSKTGETYSESVNVAIPMVDLSAQWGKLERKFHALVDSRLGVRISDQIIRYCKTLDEHDNLDGFYSLLAAPTRSNEDSA